MRNHGRRQFIIQGSPGAAQEAVYDVLMQGFITWAIFAL